MPAVRGRLQEILLHDPGYISLSIRWMAWLIALGTILLGATPEKVASGEVIALVLSCGQLLLLTRNPVWLRFEVGKTDLTRGAVMRPLADLAIALTCVALTGGWTSPFYHFAVTTVLAPSLRYGLLGALASALAYTVGYSLTVWYSPGGFTTAYLSDGRPGPDLVSTPFNPLMMGLFAAFLGEILQRLQEERARAEELAAAQERARMARDIHDGVAQTLFMLTMSLESGLVMAQKEKATVTARHLETLTPIARKALLELRNAMHNIEPLAAGEQSLGQAVGQLIRDYQSALGCQLVLREAPGFEAPGEGRVSGLFAMIQESLANACHHAEADNITLALGEPHPRSAFIEDDGKGFDPEKVRRGRGLQNLKERAAELGVEIAIVPASPGTRVELSWRKDGR